MTMRVVTWNLQWQFGPWQARQDAIDQTLSATRADVVMVQEAWPNQVQRIAEMLEFDHVWAGHDMDGNPDRAMGNAILSRYPMLDRQHTLLAERDGTRYRSIVHASLDTPAGVWPVFTTHLNHRFDQSVTRQAQLTEASTFIENHCVGDLPPILTGDLNAVPDSDEVRRLTGRSAPYLDGRIWTDAWEQVGDGPGITWSNENPYLQHSAWPNRRLDYVFIGWPRDTRPVGNPVDASLVGIAPLEGVVASDHYGLVVNIETEFASK